MTGPIAAVALVRDDGSVLLQLRDAIPGLPNAGEWVFPGGHGAPGESEHAAACRELEEETAYRVERLERLGALSGTALAGVVSLYGAEYDGHQVIRCLEGQEMRWVARSEAERLPAPAFVLSAWDELVTPFSDRRRHRLEELAS